MKLTVAYITGREEPKLEWFIDSLVTQMASDDEIHVIVVDAMEHRILGAARVELIGVMFESFRCTSPKPTVWQGKHRITRDDWWAMSNARNTALCMCETEWIAFCDDRCVLADGWLSTVRTAMRDDRAETRVVCGTYEKRHDVTIGPTIQQGIGGTLVAVDNRFTEAPNGYFDCPGQWLYGCTFALPLEWALEVNGFEEGCDSLSAEDYIFGLNLANAGYKLDFCPTMKVIQDRSPSADPGSSRFRRTDKGVSPNDKSHAALARFGPRKRTEFTPDLRAIRHRYLRGEPFPAPNMAADHRDWFDDQLVREF